MAIPPINIKASTPIVLKLLLMFSLESNDGLACITLYIRQTMNKQMTANEICINVFKHFP